MPDVSGDEQPAAAAAITIEPMRIDDYDEVVVLWRATEGMGKLESREQLAQYLERNPGLSRVAREAPSQRMVGAVLCGHDGRRGYIYHLAVALSCRRRGIGGRLVSVCLDDLAALGIERCGLQVYRSNEVGLDYWRRSGWRERSDIVVFTQDLSGERTS